MPSPTFDDVMTSNDTDAAQGFPTESELEDVIV